MQEKQDNCALKNQSQLMCHSYADKGGSTPFPLLTISKPLVGGVL